MKRKHLLPLAVAVSLTSVSWGQVSSAGTGIGTAAPGSDPSAPGGSVTSPQPAPTTADRGFSANLPSQSNTNSVDNISISNAIPDNTSDAGTVSVVEGVSVEARDNAGVVTTNPATGAPMNPRPIPGIPLVPVPETPEKASTVDRPIYNADGTIRRFSHGSIGGHTGVSGAVPNAGVGNDVRLGVGGAAPAASNIGYGNIYTDTTGEVGGVRTGQNNSLQNTNTASPTHGSGATNVGLTAGSPSAGAGAAGTAGTATGMNQGVTPAHSSSTSAVGATGTTGGPLSGAGTGAGNVGSVGAGTATGSAGTGVGTSGR